MVEVAYTAIEVYLYSHMYGPCMHAGIYHEPAVFFFSAVR